jgi:ribosomal protein S18 acetylase RimI-like enzyme
MAHKKLVVRPFARSLDEAWASAWLDDHLGGRQQARRGEVIDVLESGLGLVAERQGTPVGLLTYRLDADAIELSSMAADPEHAGIGSSLLETLERAVRAADRHWIWVVTTNDNLDALRFYQRRGFRIGEVRVGAVDRARLSIKPSIAASGAYGIPLRDEIELVLDLRLEESPGP